MTRMYVLAFAFLIFSVVHLIPVCSWIQPVEKITSFISCINKRSLTSLKVAQPTDSSEEKMKQFVPKIMSSSPDRETIIALLIGKATCVVITFLSAFVLQRDIGFEYISFDYESMRIALFIAVPMIVGRFIFDNLQWNVSKENKRDTTFFTVRTFGRETSTSTAAFLSALLASKYY